MNLVGIYSQTRLKCPQKNAIQEIKKKKNFDIFILVQIWVRKIPSTLEFKIEGGLSTVLSNVYTNYGINLNFSTFISMCKFKGWINSN